MSKWGKEPRKANISAGIKQCRFITDIGDGAYLRCGLERGHDSRAMHETCYSESPALRASRKWVLPASYIAKTDALHEVRNKMMERVQDVFDEDDCGTIESILDQVLEELE